MFLLAQGDKRQLIVLSPLELLIQSKKNIKKKQHEKLSFCDSSLPKKGQRH